MLEIRNLNKRYGEKQALNSVSFSIDGKEAVGFLGINGAGKSTTMNILTGCISASDGDVLIDGIDILTEPLKAKEKIGYLPEQPPLYLDMIVYEYLSFIYNLKKVKKNPKIQKTKKEYLEEIMNLVGIKDVQSRMIRNLSKGYRQRVGLAQALIGEPDILILDEPTVGLDPAQMIEIRTLIRSLAKTKTVLLSSHILSEVQAVCDRIIILHQGRIVADGKTDELADKVSNQLQISMEIEGNPKNILETIKKIPLVQKVQQEEGMGYNIYLAQNCTDSTPVRRTLFKTLGQAGCTILSMSKKNMNLEDIFLQLTSGEEIELLQKRNEEEQESEKKSCCPKTNQEEGE